ncbi:MAG: hypothetical protein R2724_00455 [Bryobacterales bacterium]
MKLKPEDEAAVFEQMRSLPAHGDVVPALERLQNGGIRMAALSNSSEMALAAQLRTSA